MKTITVPNGYNGNTLEADAKPILIDYNLAKLKIANSEYLTAWVRIADYPQLIIDKEIHKACQSYESGKNSRLDFNNLMNSYQVK